MEKKELKVRSIDLIFGRQTEMSRANDKLKTPTETTLGVIMDNYEVGSNFGLDQTLTDDELQQISSLMNDEEDMPKKEARYVSEKIGSEYKSWKEKDYIYLGADTGTGKTYFIFYVLAPFAKSQGEEILYLCNRISLKRDVQKLKEKAEKELDMQLTNVHVMTYQQVNKIIQRRGRDHNPIIDEKINDLKREYQEKIGICNTDEERWLLNSELIDREIILEKQARGRNWHQYHRLSCYKYIVADEFHYFAEDSMFSRDAHYSHEFIFSKSNQIKILISATGKYGLQLLQGGKPDYEYVIRNNKSTIELNFYRDSRSNNSDYPLQIISKILESEKESKVIYFVDDIERIKAIWRDHEDWRSQLTCMFSNTNSDKEGINQIDNPDVIYDIEDEMTTFNGRVLLTTSVLSNGVTLKDKNIKYIICDIPNIFTAIQCIGRKRIIDDTDKVKVYIRFYGTDYIKAMYRNAGARYLFMSNPGSGRDRYIREHGIDQIVQDCCYLDCDSIGEFAGINVPPTYIKMAIDYARFDAYEMQTKILHKVVDFEECGDKFPYISTFRYFYDPEIDANISYDFFEKYQTRNLDSLGQYIMTLQDSTYLASSPEVKKIKDYVKKITGYKNRDECIKVLQELDYRLEIKDKQRLGSKTGTTWKITKS